MRTAKWIVVVAAAVGIALVACRLAGWGARDVPPPKPPLQLARMRIPDTRFMGILPLYVAEEQGMFGRHGVQVDWLDVRDPGQAAKLFFDGQADFIMTTFANLLPAEVRQPGTLRLVFPIFESAAAPGSYILLPPASKIRTLEQLKGHTLGTYSGPSQKAYALVVLERLGLREPDDVRLVQVASSSQVQGLLGGSYDALFTVEPYGSVAITLGARVLDQGVRTKYITNPFWLGSAAVHATLSKQRPDVVEGMLDALGEAASFITAHETAARETLARRTGITKAAADRCALYTWVAHPGREQLEQIQQHIQLLVDRKQLDKAVPVDPLFMGSRQAP